MKKFPTGKDPDGASEMLAIYDGDPETYAAFALDYFEIATPVDAIAAVYRHEALTAELVAALNPDAYFDAVVAESADWPYGE